MNLTGERYDRGIQLAADALCCAMYDDWDRVSEALGDLNDELGGEGMSLAVVSWCDTTVQAWRELAGTGDGEPVQLGWLNVGTGQVEAADGVPPPVRWAGQLVAARAAMDKPSYDALIAVLPHDQEGLRAHIKALLDGAALTMLAMIAGSAS